MRPEPRANAPAPFLAPFVAPLAAAGLAALLATAFARPAEACCPAPPSGKPVVNADQTVILVWDPATKTEHFVRRASFKSEADDFGFLVPTPAQPELSESGDAAFPYLQKLTEPEVITRSRPIACGCPLSRSKSADIAAAPAPESVQVLEEKTVAGFQASVLEASSAGALVGWLKDHGYAFSPAVEAWAKPYVEGGWKITALRVAKGEAAKAAPGVAASALRLSFKTERPLFPYREPESTKDAAALGASRRLLRIYFVSDARYGGELTKDSPWTGSVAWAGKLTAADRDRARELLGLGPSGADAWVTEFEDPWPYRPAPADLYFSRSATQDAVKRPPIIHYAASDRPGGATFAALGLAFVAPLVRRRFRPKAG